MGVKFSPPHLQLLQYSLTYTKMQQEKELSRIGVERLQLVPVKRAVVKLVGKDGTGKTSLKRAFKREKFNSKQTSTGAIEVEMLVQDKRRSVWESLEKEDIRPVVKGLLHEMYNKARATGNRASAAKQSDEERERQLEDLLEHFISPPRAIIQVCDHGGQENLFASFAQFVSSNFIYIMTFDVSKPLEAVAHSLVRSIIDGELQCSQVKLHNMKYNIDWINYHLSTISVSSVSAQQQPSDGSSCQGIGSVFACASPPIIFAATHADQIIGREAEVVRSQEAALNRMLCDKQFTRHVYRRPSHCQSTLFQSELFYCIDNTKTYPPTTRYFYGLESEEDERDPELADLRQLVVSKLEKHCTTYLTPVTWLLLEDKVYEIRGMSVNKIIPFEEIVTVGLEKCAMKSRSEVSDALSYLHDFSVVVYFEMCPNLKNVVFIDAPWVYTTLSRLNPIHASNMPAILRYNMDVLHREGIMSQQLANYLLPDLTDDDRATMLKAAELLDIVSHYEQKLGDSAVADAGEHDSVYFVPSALREDDKIPDIMEKGRRGTASPVPLVLRPDNVGIFIDVLFFRLLNRCIRQFPRKPYLRRNHAILHMDNGSDLELLYVYHYLIMIMKENPQLPYEAVHKSCVAARKFVIKELEDVKQQGLAGFKFSVCFQHLTSAEEKFLPIQSERLVSLNDYPEPQFLLCDNTTVDLTVEQEKSINIWFDAAPGTQGVGLHSRRVSAETRAESIHSQTVPGKPVADIDSVITAVINHGMDQWYQIGSKLGLTQARIMSVVEGIPNPGKLQAVIDTRRKVVGDDRLRQELLDVCDSISFPIRGDVDNELRRLDKSDDLPSTSPSDRHSTVAVTTHGDGKHVQTGSSAPRQDIAGRADSKVGKKQMVTVARKLRCDLREFAALLDADIFTRSVMDGIEGQCKTPFSKGQAVLEKWMDSLQEGATCRLLIEALYLMNLNPLAAEVFDAELVAFVHEQQQ